MSVIKRMQGNQFNNTVERVKAHFYLPNYVAKLTGWVKGSGEKNGVSYWYTFCPMCQPDETRKSKHKFWLNRDVCGCFNPRCTLYNGKCDVIALHAIVNRITLTQAISDLAKRLN